MKLTPEQKRIELAKLDKWAHFNPPARGYSWWKDGIKGKMVPPNYPESFDAIIPLIQKQPEEIKSKVYQILAEQSPNQYYFDWRLLDCTCGQLSDALLKAHGFDV